MDIPGLKNLRLLAVQPIALLPTMGIDMTPRKEYFIEFTFDSGSVLNIPIKKEQHDKYLLFMKQQGTGVEQRVVASQGVPSAVEHFRPHTGVAVPITGPVDIEATLRSAAREEVIPAKHVIAGQAVCGPPAPGPCVTGPTGPAGPGPCSTGPTGATGG